MLSIVNIALARLGETPVQSVDEGSVPANMAKIFYDQSRRATLRDYNWSFALKQVLPARLADKLGYQIPADCLKIVDVRTPEGRPGSLRYNLRGKVIECPADRIVLEYIYDCKDTSCFDDKFIEALSYKLASELAMPLKGSGELMGSYMNAYTALVTKAANTSINERQEEYCENPYLESRR